MKYKLLIYIIFIATILTGFSCTTAADTSQYTIDQVLEVAENVSPYCRKQVVTDEGSG